MKHTEQAELLGLSFDTVTMDVAVARCLELCRAPRSSHMVITANASHLCMMRRDPELARACHAAHLTVADGKGNVVTTTQTINSLFGARFIVPGTGMIPNDYMSNFDPRPGNALSIAPGKRVTTSMSPMMALRDGKLIYALGLPGGKRIFPSAMQALINLIDHGMGLQEAVEAPRVWTEGNALEVEQAVPDSVRATLTAMGHKVLAVPTVAGGMNAIQFHEDGTMSGAACWRADGTPIGLAGALARAGVRFGLT